ncbi:hypothetical protein EYF80_003012 [Liparis tanakae]|uniref:Uncharacterized protein n=1 Tax=Liparis tanakae TaxID=230148 RepID=A0A4Z2J9D4_9TELE|nr:hypothetical protein EYF80_003012 [Liparis tanakae]
MMKCRESDPWQGLFKEQPLGNGGSTAWQHAGGLISPLLKGQIQKAQPEEKAMQDVFHSFSITFLSGELPPSPFVAGAEAKALPSGCSRCLICMLNISTSSHSFKRPQLGPLTVFNSLAEVSLLPGAGGGLKRERPGMREHNVALPTRREEGMFSVAAVLWPVIVCKVDPAVGGRAPLVAAMAARLGPDPGGYNGAVENVLSVDGGAACGGRKECGDRGHPQRDCDTHFTGCRNTEDIDCKRSIPTVARAHLLTGGNDTDGEHGTRPGVPFNTKEEY